MKIAGIIWDNKKDYSVKEIYRKLISENKENYNKLRKYFINYFKNASNEIRNEIKKEFIVDNDNFVFGDRIELNLPYLYTPIIYNIETIYFISNVMDYPEKEFLKNGFSKKYVKLIISEFERKIDRFINRKSYFKAFDMFDNELYINDDVIVSDDTYNSSLILGKIVERTWYNENILKILFYNGDTTEFLLTNNKSNSILKLNDSYKTNISIYRLKN